MLTPYRTLYLKRLLSAGLLAWLFRALPNNSSGQDQSRVAYLLEALRSDDSSVRLNAAWEANYIQLEGEEAVAILPALVAAKKDRVRSVRRYVSLSLRIIMDSLARAGRPVVPSLIKLLDRKEGRTSNFVATVLADIGEPAVPDLIKATKSTNTKRVRAYALEKAIALGRGTVMNFSE